LYRTVERPFYYFPLKSEEWLASLLRKTMLLVSIALLMCVSRLASTLSVDLLDTWSTDGLQASLNYYAVCSDNYGLVRSAVVKGGGIFTFDVISSSWVSGSVLDGSGDPVVATQEWTSVACSGNGSKVAAASYNGLIYVSSDSGLTFHASISSGTDMWISVSVNSGGDVIYAAAFNGMLYKSDDFGQTWTNIHNESAWSCVTTESNGTLIVAASSQTSVDVESALYLSSNGGSTWTIVPDTQDVGQWWVVNLDATGQYLAAAIDKGGIYISNDYGASISRAVSAPSMGNWRSLAVSSGGQRIAAAAQYIPSPTPTPSPAPVSGIYLSEDYGASWSRSSAPAKLSWRSVAVDQTGTYLIAAAQRSAVYFINTTATAVIPSEVPTARPSTIAPTSTRPSGAQSNSGTTYILVTVFIVVGSLVTLAWVYRTCGTLYQQREEWRQRGRSSSLSQTQIQELQMRIAAAAAAQGRGGVVVPGSYNAIATAEAEVVSGGDSAVFAGGNVHILSQESSEVLGRVRALSVAEQVQSTSEVEVLPVCENI
jgi:hypothetical protein